MPSPDGSFNLSGRVYGGSATSIGNLMVADGTGFYLVANAANRALYGRAQAIATSNWGGAQSGVVSLQFVGTCDSNLPNVGVGTAGRWVRCSAAGAFEVFTPTNGGSSDIVGCANAAGVVTMLFGVLTESLIVPPASGGGTPGGSDKQVQINNAGAFAGSTSLTFDGTGLAIGATPATSGDVRLSSTGRCAMGAANLTAIQGNGATLNIGQDNAGGTQYPNVQVFPSANLTFGVGAAAYFALSGNLCTANKPIACGTGTVASTGDIRLSATGQINFDRGGSNILGLWMDTGTSLGVGNANATAVTLYSGIDINFMPAGNVTIGGPVIGNGVAWGSVNGIGTQAMADANQTPAVAVFRNAAIKTTGALTANRNLTLPTATDAQGYAKWINNTCSGAFSVNVTCAAGTQVLVANGKSASVWIDSRGVTRMTADI